MDIPDMKVKETDLDRFLKFADNISDGKYKVIKEDWGSTCGIIIARELELKKEYVIFNFYGNGDLRHVFLEVEPIEEIPEKSLLRKIIAKTTWWRSR